MLKSAVFTMVGFLVAGTTTASAADPCPPAQYTDYMQKYKLDASANFLTKLLSKFGLGGSYEEDAKQRLPTQDEQIMAIVTFGTICRMVVQDNTLSTAQRVDILQKWLISIAAYSPSKGSWDGRALRNQFAGNSSESMWKTSSSRCGDRPAVLSPPPPPAKGAPILRVFLKSNLTMDQVIELRKSLPQFDIRLGRSTHDPKNPADILIVDRNNVSERQVLDVLRALHSENIRIKSVQQFGMGRPEIQIGTVLLPKGVPAFADKEPLDLDKLSSLSGDEFWKTAMNGEAWCWLKIEEPVPCSISQDGRPVRL
jgi:hypothetical protein